MLGGRTAIIGLNEQPGQDAVVSWAGYYAEKRFAPSTHWLGGCQADIDAAARSMTSILGPPNEHNRDAHQSYERIVRRLARDLVYRPSAWRAIRALAKVLLERQTISGPEATRIVRGSGVGGLSRKARLGRRGRDSAFSRSEPSERGYRR
jgi:hypothetical protein